MTYTIAKANANVALAKYWGKRNALLNLPYTGSLSITLAGLETTARVALRADLSEDYIVLNGQRATGAEGRRVSVFLDLVRRMAGERRKAEVEVHTGFPVSAGLASSASTFAALALAASSAAKLSLAPAELSVLARRGSGSAARSIFGGFVEWLPGEASDGSDSFSVQVAPRNHWQLGVVVAVTETSRKQVGSGEGMARALRESPFFPAWLGSHDVDLDAIRQGVLDRDLALVGKTAEHNCLKMHAVSMAARPALLYWTPATFAVIQRVVQLREEGTDAYFTIDAGPQVKVLCPWSQRTTVADALRAVDGVQRVLLSEPGPGAELMENG